MQAIYTQAHLHTKGAAKGGRGKKAKERERFIIDAAPKRGG